MLLSRPPKDRRLAPFIEAFWTCEVSNPAGLEHVLPNGRVQLFINLHDDGLTHYDRDGAVRQRASATVLQGPAVAPVVIARAEQRKLCGVLFSPGGGYSILGIPLPEPGSQLVDLGDLAWGNVRVLREHLDECSDPETRLDVLEAESLGRAPELRDWDLTVRRASHLLRKGWRVQTVAEAFGTTQQTLITRFRERTGLTPKVFSRIERFQRLVRTHAGASSWADAAIQAGFSDQSHMVREFKSFAGITPTQYKPTSESEPNHLPMLI